MKLCRLDLKNIGSFFGIHGFDLEIKSPHKNIILFGGKNGSGKTTLLESFRLVLFGPLTYGYKTENDVYLNKIASILNNKAVKSGETDFQIKLELEQVENFEKHKDVLIRNWKYHNNKIKESFVVIRNGRVLNKVETEIYESNMREQFPPQLFELCLFDGEEISKIISEERLESYLKNASRVLFNLDVFDNLENDLNNYIEIYSKKNNISDEEQKYNDLSREINEMDHELRQLKKGIGKLEKDLLTKKDRISLIKKDFATYGGLMKDQRDTLHKELMEIEGLRKENNEHLKSFISGLFPIYLVKDLLLEVKNQMQYENDLEINDYIDKRLKSEDFAQFVKDLKREKIINSTIQSETIESLLREQFLETNVSEKNTKNYIHRASFEQRSQIHNLLNQITNINGDDYVNKFNENHELLKTSQLLRKKIENNDETTELNQLLIEIETLTKEIEIISTSLIELEEQKYILLDSMNNRVLEREKVRKTLNSQGRAQKTLILSSNVAEISRKFRKIQLRKKLKQVEFEALKMINKIFRKENYVKDIQINFENMEMKLFGFDHKEIIKERLSAGEKELLMLSIIWAMFSTSGRRVPFIFDTLLGRLDQDHRKEIIKEFLPNCGEQVIILSTDSEISEENFELLSPVLSKCFTLEFNVEKSWTNVTEGSFFSYLTGEVIST